MFIDEVSKFSTVAPLSHDMDDHEPESARANALDDIFGGDSDEEPRSTRDNHVSDVPRLQGIHATNGYREGLATSKETFLQEGFDEGYSLGAEIGAAAGRIIGLLESLLLAIKFHDANAEHRTELIKLLAGAKDELTVKSLYGKEYFGEDGIWKYELVSEQESEEGHITLRIVARDHPLILKWKGTVADMMKKHGLQEMAS